MRTKRSGMTVVEILVVVGIIATLVGLLLPAVHTVQKMAKETKQKAQFTAISLGLEAFKNDYGDYPPSNGWDPRPGAPLPNPTDYCGAQKLAEAMLGWDLLGFHPKSVWQGTGGPVGIYKPADAASLEMRKSRYVELEVANPFRLGVSDQGDGLFTNTTGTSGQRLEPDTYVLCDVFPVNERKVRLSGGKIVSPGTPILYYRANPASRTIFDPTTYVRPEDRIYNARDNWPLISLRRLADWAQPIAARRVHKLDTAYALTPYDTRNMVNAGDDFAYFYQEYIRDFKVSATVWPVRPDSYLLISAGMDGLYGTDDDIRNFGN